MYINKLILCLFTLTLIFSSNVFAADHGEEKPAEGHGEAEAKPEEGGGEHGEKTGDIKRAPWMEVESRVQDLHARVKSKQGTINKLLEEKEHMANGSAELKAAIDEIIKEHKDLRKLTEDYKKNLSILQYRFPERNAKSGRKYDRIEVKSLEEMEQAMGIDGKLNRNLGRMRSQYKMAPTAKQTKTNSEKNSDHSAENKPKGQSIEDAGSIIINK